MWWDEQVVFPMISNTPVTATTFVALTHKIYKSRATAIERGMIGVFLKDKIRIEVT